MRQNEHPVAGSHLIGSNRRKHNGFAGAGGQHQQGAGVAGVPLGVDAVTGLLLVGSQFLPHQNAPCVQPCEGAALGAGGGRKRCTSLLWPVSPA